MTCAGSVEPTGMSNSLTTSSTAVRERSATAASRVQGMRAARSRAYTRPSRPSPINATFKGQSFNINDEVYKFKQDSWSRDNVHVLTSIDYSMMSESDKKKESSPRTDHDFGLSWIRREGQGRVFYQALGHHESIYYDNPQILEHILAGMQYALGDLKADDTPSAKLGGTGSTKR